jgi:GNAT superfamily N-acetyltransferase
MKLIEVKDKKTQRQFLEVPKILYKNDPFFVCPLDSEINGIFDPKKNLYFNDGEAIRWILKDDRGKLIGRVAAFYNMKKARMFDPLAGQMGFFECINNREAAFMLFDAAKEWLKSKNMGCMDAPTNFGENQNYWGLLVKGFMPQGFGMPYNFPYYQQLFEDYGFKNFYEQYSYHRYIPDAFPERFNKIAEWVAKREGITYKHINFKESEKFIADMVEIYNEAWAQLKSDFIPMEPSTIRDVFKKSKSIIDEELIWFAYKNEEPAAFYVIFPDINQILKHINGKLNFFNILKLLYYKRKGAINRARALVAGVKPKYQNKGIESGFFKILFELLQNKPYKEIELSWVGDFNPKMLAFYKGIGGVEAKMHITYRYMFDPNVPFIRFKDMKHNSDQNNNE